MAENPGLNIRVISNDKDLKQLLCGPGESSGGTSCVELYDIHKDLVFDGRG